MKYADIKAMMAEIAPVIREYTASAIAPLVERIGELEKQIASLPVPRDGKDADEDAIVERVTAKMAGEIAQVRAAIDAIQIPEIPDVEGMIAGAIDAINEQRNQDMTEVRALIEEVDGRIDSLPQPRDGKDADPEEIRGMVAEEVSKAIEALPKPQDGKSVTVEDVRPLIEECVSVAVSAIPKPKDGRGIKELLIDRDGNLVVTLDDGDLWRVGHVVGKDADMPAIMKAIETQVKEAVAAIPKPQDGKDGVGFDDMRMEEREDGCFLVFERGETVKEFRVPVVIDRGVYSAGRLYRRGDGVTWAGSFWIAQEDTTEKPDTGKGWRLAVKKGRDGKDAK